MYNLIELISILKKNELEDNASNQFEISIFNPNLEEIKILDYFNIKYVLNKESNNLFISVLEQKNIKIYYSLQNAINYNSSISFHQFDLEKDVILILKESYIYDNKDVNCSNLELFNNIYYLPKLINVLSEKLSFHYDSLKNTFIFYSSQLGTAIKVVAKLKVEEYSNNYNILNLIKVFNSNNINFFKRVNCKLISEIEERDDFNENAVIDFNIFLNYLKLIANENVLIYDYLVENVSEQFENHQIELFSFYGNKDKFIFVVLNEISNYLSEKTRIKLTDAFNKVLSEKLYWN